MRLLPIQENLFSYVDQQYLSISYNEKKRIIDLSKIVERYNMQKEKKKKKKNDSVQYHRYGCEQQADNGHGKTG